MSDSSTLVIVRLALYLNRYSDLARRAKPFIDSDGSNLAEKLLEDIKSLEDEITSWRESLGGKQLKKRTKKDNEL